MGGWFLGRKKRTLSPEELDLIAEVMNRLAELEELWEEEYEDSEIFYDYYSRPVLFPIDARKRVRYARKEFKRMFRRLIRLYKRLSKLTRYERAGEVLSKLRDQISHLESEVRKLTQKEKTVRMIGPEIPEGMPLKELRQYLSPEGWAFVEQQIAERIAFLGLMLEECEYLRHVLKQFESAP